MGNMRILLLLSIFVVLTVAPPPNPKNGKGPPLGAKVAARDPFSANVMHLRRSSFPNRVRALWENDAAIPGVQITFSSQSSFQVWS